MIDAKTMCELGIIQPGDRVYVDWSPDAPGRSWGTVGIGSDENTHYDTEHVYAKWDSCPYNLDPTTKMFGVYYHRIIDWQPDLKRLKEAK